MNDADIESRAVKLYSVWSKALGEEFAWDDLTNDEQSAWREVAKWTLTHES